jgi:arylsulfatase
MIASWPGTIQAGSVTHHPLVFYDVMPTLAEVAGIESPLGTSGISFLPALKGKIQEEHTYLYWEFPEYGGQMAVRIGDLKALRKGMHNGNLQWQLFDLESDPGETTDISDSKPEVLEMLEQIVASEHTYSENPRWRFNAMGE